MVWTWGRDRGRQVDVWIGRWETDHEGMKKERERWQWRTERESWGGRWVLLSTGTCGRRRS